MEETQTPFFFDAPDPAKTMPHEWGPFPGEQLIDETIKLMTLVGPSCPIVALRTNAIVTPAISYALHGRGTSFQHPEIVGVGGSTTLTNEVRHLRAPYRALSPRHGKLLIVQSPG